MNRFARSNDRQRQPRSPSQPKRVLLWLEELEDRLAPTIGFNDPGPAILAKSFPAVTSKLEGIYAATIHQVEKAGSNEDPESRSFASGLSDIEVVKSGLAKVNDAGQIQTYVRVDAIDEQFLAQLRELGITIEASSQATQSIRAWLSPTQASQLATLPEVRSLRLPDYRVVRTGSVNSAGDSLHRANLVRNNLSINGTGVKVGVISDGVDNQSLVSGSPNFDLDTVTVDSSRPGSGNEGTAMLEIVHDLAPGAELYFSGPSDSLEMVDSINWLVSQGCDIIVDDLGFFFEPYFEDGPVAQAAANAIAAGVTYLSAAGNDAENHYQAQFSDSNANGVHNYATGDEGLRVTIPAGGAITVFMQWSDPFGGSGNDYDLYLYNSSLTSVLTGSDAAQTGTQDPIEAFS